MANSYYSDSGNPADGSSASSSDMRAEFALIEAGFDKLPSPSAGAYKIIRIKSSNDSLEAAGYFIESTWTPVVKLGGVEASNYTASGRYTRIGARVLFEVLVTFAGAPTATGALTISLPTTASASAIDAHGAVAIKNATSAPANPVAVIGASDTEMSLHTEHSVTGASFTVMADTHLSNTAVVHVSGHYEV